MGSWTRHFLAKAVEFVKSDIFTNVMEEVFFSPPLNFSDQTCKQ